MATQKAYENGDKASVRTHLKERISDARASERLAMTTKTAEVVTAIGNPADYSEHTLIPARLYAELLRTYVVSLEQSGRTVVSLSVDHISALLNPVVLLQPLYPGETAMPDLGTFPNETLGFQQTA